MRFLLPLFGLALVACPPSPVVPPPDADAAPPFTDEDSAPPGPASDTFQKACDTLVAASCPEASPKNGQSCHDFLQVHADMIDAACIATAIPTRAALAACMVRCQP